MVVCRGPGSGDLGGCTTKVLGKRAGMHVLLLWTNIEMWQ